MSKNTSELWSVVPGFYPGFVEIFGASFKISVVTHAADISLVESMNRIEDARRIVACVNACAGLPTEQLESSPPGGVLNGVAGLMAQRNELLAALEGLLDIVGESDGVSGYHLNGDIAEWGEFEELNAAYDAVNKANGGAA